MREDIDIDVKIIPEERAFTPVHETSFVKRHFPVLVVVICSCFSLTFMSWAILKNFKASKAEKSVVQTEVNRSYEELVEADKKYIRLVSQGVFGPEEPIMITEYSPRQTEEIKYRIQELRTSRGNLFVQVGSMYYYLSSDGKRLYHVWTANSTPVRNLNHTIRPQTTYQNMLVQPSPKKEIIYKDKDGFWRNKQE